MVKINILGSIFGSTGYDSHSRQLAKALYKLNPEVSLECPKIENWHVSCPDDVFKMCTNSFPQEHNVLIQLPPFWKLKASDRPKSVNGFLVFEGDRIPSPWVKDCNDDRINNVFVPSQHTINAALNSGVNKEKLKIVPHGVDLDLFKPLDRAPFGNLLPSDKFTFGFNGGWAQGKNDRKDFGLLLRAFAEEFKPSDPVRLVAHINPAYGTDVNKINQDLQSLGLQGDKPEALIFCSNISFVDLPKLYSLMDVFVCPSRAEAFGLVFLEAMACGVPCIAGSFGGNSDFINNENGWLLDKYQLIPSKDQNYFYEGINWAEYDVKQLRAFMREAYENANLRKGKAEKALATSKAWSWENSARKLLEVLQKDGT